MKNKLTIIFSSISALLLFITIVFLAYSADYYKADDTATTILKQDTLLLNDDSLLVLPVEQPTIGIIFYPGAKVDESAYLPLLQKLQHEGILCVVTKMPFHLAIFNQNAADAVIENFPTVEHWFIGGHSLGGAMASSYYATHVEQLDGLILLGSYVYGDFSTDNVLLLYGSEDHVLNRDKLTIPVLSTYILDGGNHAYFGNYGEQKGDGTATISREEQQSEAVYYILDFLAKRS